MPWGSHPAASSTPSPKSNRRRFEAAGTSPRDVQLRTLQQSPFAGVAQLGRAEDSISNLHNAERMHTHYSDSSTHSPRAKSRDALSSQGSDSTAPRLKWTVDPGMSMWGNVLQPNLAPASFASKKHHNLLPIPGVHDSMSDNGSHVGSHAPSTLSSILGFRNNDSVASISTPRARVDWSQNRERQTRSMARLDPANLSNSMKRSLSAARRRDSSAEPARGVGLAGGHPTSASPSARSVSPHVSVGGSRGASPSRSSRRVPPSAAGGRGGVKDERSFFSFRSCLSLESTTEEMDQTLCAKIMRDDLSSRGKKLPGDLYAEFVVLKDTLDAKGGCQVGFGGMGLLRRHVLRGQTDTETMVVVEVELCTHGYSGRGAGVAEKNPYYQHYMSLCDAIEAALYPTWNLAFVIKKAKPRVGAFEVSLIWLVGSVECTVTLFSKLCTRTLPNVHVLTSRIACALEGPERDAGELAHQEGGPGEEEEGAWGGSKALTDTSHEVTEERERVNTLVMKWNSAACEPPPNAASGSPLFSHAPPPGDDHMKGDPFPEG